MSKEHHGFFYGVISALASAGVALFAKLSTSASVSTLVFSRFALAIPILLWLTLRGKLTISLKQIPKHLLRNLASLSALYAYFFAIQLLPLVNAVTLVNTAPLFIPLIVLFWLKLLVSKRRFLAAFIGFLGVVVLLHPGEDFFQKGSVIGLLAGLLGAISLTTVRQLSKTESTLTILAYYFLIGAVLSFFPFFINWTPMTDATQWLYLFLSGICALIFQYTLTKAYTHAPASKVSTVSYLSVVFSGLLGWLVLHEVPNYWVFFGVLLIIAGALFALFDRSTPRPIGRKR
jgi:drug/metabolite transporter (DMT)-like permease